MPGLCFDRARATFHRPWCGWSTKIVPPPGEPPPGLLLTADGGGLVLTARNGLDGPFGGDFDRLTFEVARAMQVSNLKSQRA